MAVATSRHPDGPSGRKRSRRSIAPFAVGAALIGTAVVLWFGLATVGARRIAFPAFDAPALLGDPRSACGADFQDIKIQRSDGRHLAAWFVPASKPAAVILLHGAGSNRHEMLPFLKVIHDGGYPAMVIDEIDHGDSDNAGWGVGYGWRQRDDVHAAVAAMRARGYTKIGALGLSQGAATAILAQAQAHSLDAIVSDSAFANLGSLIRRQPSVEGLHPAFVATMLWEAGFWIGASPDRISPVDAARHLGDCALLVIQGGKDTLVPAGDGRLIYAVDQGKRDLWMVPEAEHVGAINVSRDIYAKRVIGFFDRYLLANGPSPDPGP